MNIGIVGATGLVGETLIKEIVENLHLPFTLHFFVANGRNVEKVSGFRKNIYPINDITSIDLDVVLFATPQEVSKLWIPVLLKNTSVFIIDGSAAFRKSKNVPLIIPEINGDILNSGVRCVASPNCTTTIALMALAPLHKLGGLRSFCLNSYQAASGLGRKGVRELIEQSKAWNNGRAMLSPSVFPRTLFFNAVPQVGEVLQNGDTEEEEKVSFESKKILNLPGLKVFSTCVRISVLQCHSLSISASFEQEIDIKTAQEVLSSTKGIKFYEKGYPDVYSSINDSLCHVGRLRIDETHPNALGFWVVGNQLKKGAATNMRQILELKLKS